MCKSIAIVAALGFFGMTSLTLIAVDTARSAPVGSKGDNPFAFTPGDVQVDKGGDDESSKSGKRNSKSKTPTPAEQAAPKPPKK